MKEGTQTVTLDVRASSAQDSVPTRSIYASAGYQCNCHHLSLLEGRLLLLLSLEASTSMTPFYRFACSYLPREHQSACQTARQHAHYYISGDRACRAGPDFLLLLFLMASSSRVHVES